MPIPKTKLYRLEVQHGGQVTPVLIHQNDYEDGASAPPFERALSNFLDPDADWCTVDEVRRRLSEAPANAGVT